MKWTKQIPQEDGFYWFKATGDFHPFLSTNKQIPVVVLVHDHQVKFFSGTFNVNMMAGVWSGPIPVPED